MNSWGVSKKVKVIFSVSTSLEIFFADISGNFVQIFAWEKNESAQGEEFLLQHFHRLQLLCAQFHYSIIIEYRSPPSSRMSQDHVELTKCITYISRIHNTQQQSKKIQNLNICATFEFISRRTRVPTTQN